MTNQRVTYELNDGIATITLDDGKRNALSPAMFKEIYAAFEQAEQDQAIVILTGREKVFSAGFDLKVMKGGGRQTIAMLKAGYSLTARIMEYPYPVIAACNGHVLAMGVFMMLSSDYILGTEGDFKVSANEVALGLPFPRVAETVMRHRLTPAAFQRGVCLAEYFPVDAAREAGFFDELVKPAELQTRAQEKARQFAEELDMDAHCATKRRIRKDTIRRIRRLVPLDLKDAVVLGVRAAVKKKKASA